MPIYINVIHLHARSEPNPSPKQENRIFTLQTIQDFRHTHITSTLI